MHCHILCHLYVMRQVALRPVRVAHHQQQDVGSQAVKPRRAVHQLRAAEGGHAQRRQGRQRRSAPRPAWLGASRARKREPCRTASHPGLGQGWGRARAGVGQGWDKGGTREGQGQGRDPAPAPDQTPTTAHYAQPPQPRPTRRTSCAAANSGPPATAAESVAPTKASGSVGVVLRMESRGE